MVFFFRAAPTSYLPADDYDYEEDLGGYKARSDDIAGYGDDDLSGYGDGRAEYGDDQYQYDEESEDKLEEVYASAAGAAASDLGRPADEEYGAPAFGSESNVDPNYAALDEGYSAPAGAGADAFRTTDEEYGVPDH